MQADNIVLDGDVGYNDLAALAERAQALTASPRDVVLQWGEVNWIHFACLQYLVALKRTLEQTGHRLIVSETPAPVARLLRDFGLSDLLGAA